MIEKQSVKKNYILNTLYRVFQMIVPLVTAPYVSRVLGVEGVGTYSYSFSLVSVFCVFALLGTSVYGQQIVAQKRDDELERSKNFWEIEILCLITTVVVIASWIVFLTVVGTNKIYLAILTLNLISAGFDISWYYAGIENFSIIVLRNFFIRCVTVILIFTCVKSKNDLIVYFFIQSLGQLLSSLSLWVPLKKTIIIVPFSKLGFKEHFKQTIIYFIPTVAASVYSYIDKTMIGAITQSAVENGYYEQAQKILDMAYTVVASINTVLSSRIAYLFAKEEYDEIRKSYKKSSVFISVIACPLMFGIVAVAPHFVPWYFGEGYDEVANLLRLGIPFILVNSIHNFLAAQYLVPSGKRAKSTYGVLIGAAVNFLLNSLLIPKYGSEGAIVASVISEIAICTVYFSMSRDFIPIKMIIKSLFKPIVASIIMYFCVIQVAKINTVVTIQLLLQVLVGGVVYYIVLLLLRETLVYSTTKRMIGILGRGGNNV